MDLHGQMMNLQTPSILTFSNEDSPFIAYKKGHRDARHAAAELALKADACVDALRALLDRYTDIVNCGECCKWNPEREDQVIAARAALAAVGARIEPGVGRLVPERAETQLGVHWLGGRPYMLTRDAQAEKQPAVNTWPPYRGKRTPADPARDAGPQKDAQRWN